MSRLQLSESVTRAGEEEDAASPSCLLKQPGVFCVSGCRHSKLSMFPSPYCSHCKGNHNPRVIHEQKEKRERERSRQKCHIFYKQITAVKCHHFSLMLLKRWEMILCQYSSCLYRIRFPSTAVIINKLIIDNI